jgi:ferrous iron transport protein A
LEIEMEKKLITLSSMKIGQKGLIDSFTDENISLKLMEMGCTPGEEVTLDKIAPMGDPIAIKVSGYTLSLRKAEASTVLVSILTKK